MRHYEQPRIYDATPVHHRHGRGYVKLMALLGLLAFLLLAILLLARQADPLYRRQQEAAYYQQQQIDRQLSSVDVWLALGWRLLPLAFLGGLGYVALRAVYVRYVLHSADMVDVLRLREIHKPGQTPQTLTYSPHMARSRTDVDALPSMYGALPEPEPLALPGPVDLASLNYQPTKDAILLGIDAHQQQITVPALQLCHVALLAPTGGGKSNAMRLILPQLQAIGARCLLADPHYAPLDAETGEDWTPIARRLHLAPAVKPSEIDALLDWSMDELARRLERRNAGERAGPPIFLAFDELPVIADEVPKAMDRISKILREGRKIGLLTVGSSQDFLVKTLGGAGSIRDCYRTAVYSGGDTRSASLLLDMPQREIDEGVFTAPGVALLRSRATQPARLVRVPLASNDALYALLDKGSGKGADEGSDPRPFGFHPARPEPIAEPITEPIGSTHQDAPKALSPKAMRVRDLLREKVGVDEIIRRVWGVERNTRAGRKAYEELQEILAALVGA